MGCTPPPNFSGVLKFYHESSCHGLLNFKCLITNHATFDTQLEHVSVSRVHTSMQATVYQIWKTMTEHNPKHWEENWKYDMQWSIFDKLQGVWKCEQMLPWVFDLSSWWKLNLRKTKTLHSSDLFAMFSTVKNTGTISSNEDLFIRIRVVFWTPYFFNKISDPIPIWFFSFPTWATHREISDWKF